jgi:RND family efflux transporter MFP subunit
MNLSEKKRISAMNTEISIRFPLIIIAAVLFAAGCNRDKGAGEATPSAKVTSIIARSAVFEKRIRTSGTVNSSRDVDLFFRIGGTVAEIFADEGEQVRDGQLLAVLDTLSMKAYMDLAKADYDLSLLELERLKRLHAEGHITPSEYNLAETQHRKAKASYQLAKEKYSDCTLRSPIDGKVVFRGIERGENIGDIAAQSTLAFRISDLDTVYIDCFVSEKTISLLSEGMDAVVEVESSAVHPIEGTVSKISCAAMPGTHLFRTRIQVENHEEELMPGMVARVSLLTGILEDVYIIPADCVIESRDGAWVYLSRGERIHRVPVTVVERDLDVAVIGQGIVTGDTVVVSNVENLFPGKLIRSEFRDEDIPKDDFSR